MAQVTLEGSKVVVKLGLVEKLTALRGGMTIPLSQVRSASTLQPNFWFRLGIRVPGTGLPPFYMAGTYLKPGDRAFVVWNRKHTPLQLELEGNAYTRVVIGVDNAEEWAAKITAVAKI